MVNSKSAEQEIHKHKKNGYQLNTDTRFYYLWGERGDLNPRPPGPQPGALTN